MRVHGLQARWQQGPAGMRDLLPQEAERRRRLLVLLREVFLRWGYREVATPAIEFLDTFLRGVGSGIQDRLFKLLDAGGELLTLRADMTVPIARLAATRLAAGTAPLRLAYAAPVFRFQETGPGTLREFTQAGVELIGDGTVEGDAEVIALAAEALTLAGMADAVVHVSHLGFLQETLRGLTTAQAAEVRARLYSRAFVGLDEGVDDADAARVLRALPHLHGREALARARPLTQSRGARQALDALAILLERLDAYGSFPRVVVDLRLVRDFDYYTGVVFEAYGSRSAFPLLGGGRYDGLLGRFGADRPATGFALGVERLVAAGSEGDLLRQGLLLAGPRSERESTIGLATALRRTGRAVTVCLTEDWVGALEQARSGEMARAAWVEGQMIRVRDLPDGPERAVRAADLLAEARDQLAEALEQRTVHGTWSH